MTATTTHGKAFSEVHPTVQSATLAGPRTEALPASVLRDHGDVTWLMDSDTASLLPDGSAQKSTGRS